MKIIQHLRENGRRYLAMAAYFTAALILPGLIMLLGKVVLGL